MSDLYDQDSELTVADLERNFLLQPLPLTERYAEEVRKYHTIEHIIRILELFVSRPEFENVRPTMSKRILLACWYHDAVYKPWRTDNEELSALVAKSDLATMLPANLENEQLITDVMRLVRSTAKHDPTQEDEQILSDLDLSILGESPHIYDAYVRGIMEEYSFVTPEEWREGRMGVLKGFLERESIFVFLKEFEAPARANMERELADLHV